MSMNPDKTIDPEKVPKRVLYNVQEIPAIGMGTFASENYTAEEVAGAVEEAIKMGYRHIDCAAVYGNEKEIGEVLNYLFKEGVVERKDLWITSKLWNDKHAEEDVIPACKQSIEDLQVGYLDLYLTHWPFPNAHPPGADIESRDPNAQPYIHENYMKTWRQMEKLVDQGLVRHIGTSNHTIAKMTRLLHDARIKPVANQMELHPHFQQAELFRFLINNGIQPIGFSPLGSPKRPERDRTEKDTVDIEDPVIVQIAENHGIHPALVCLKWAVQRGQIPIPFSVKHEKLYSNLEAVTEDYLTEEEMTQIAGIDKNCRLIKGQVFLWKDNQSWEDLWDPHGRITPP